MVRTSLTWIFLALPAFCGTNYFVSANVTSGGDGSSDRPWTLTAAIASGSGVGPGDTIWLRRGTYVPPDGILFNCYATGASGAPVTIRPMPGEKVIIQGAFYIRQPWLVLRDLEFLSVVTNRVSNDSGSSPTDIIMPDGVGSFAPHVKIINNVVHDQGSGISAWRDASDNEIYGNIIFNNGYLGPDRGHGHGFYMQNSGEPKYITDNLVFHQFGLGMQLYGSSQTFLENFILEGNILFNNGAPSGQKTRNILLGGGIVATNPIIRHNYTYYDTSDPEKGDNNIGYYIDGAGCTNLILDNNYFVSGAQALTLNRCTVTSLTGNTFFGDLRNWSSSSYPINTFLGRNRPAGATVFVRPNRYEAGRAHIAVFNWDRASSVSVNLSSIGLAVGSNFEIRDAQNLSGTPVVQGVYDGQPVSIPQNLVAIIQPYGNAPIFVPHTNPEFNAFVVWKAGSVSSNPLSIANLAVTQITETSAWVNWTTNVPASDQLFWGLTSAFGQSTPLIASNSTTHSAMLTGLTPNTTYYIKAFSVSGSDSSMATGSFSTLAPPLQITNSQVGSITRNSAVVTWTTNRATNDQVEFGTTNQYGQQTAAGTVYGTAHSVMVPGLTADTTYYLKLISSEQNGNRVSSEGLSFRTLPPGVTMSNARIGATTPSSATILWSTSLATTDVVSYGTTMSYRTGRVTLTAPGTSHSALIPDLAADTTYYARIESTDQFGSGAVVEGLTFKTPATPLEFRDFSPFAITNNTAAVSWATSRPAGVQILYGPTTQYGATINLPTLRTSSSTEISGLTPGTMYYLKIKATDSGGVSAEATASFTTTGGVPTALQISGLQAGTITQNSATISWTTNVHSSRQVRYGTTTGLGSATVLDTALASSHVVLLSGLRPATTYYFQAISTDGSNRTATSAVGSFTTSPTTPVALQLTNVQAGSITQNSVVISWNTNLTANDRVLWGTTAGLGQSTPTGGNFVTTHSVTLTGLSAGTTYYFQAVSSDTLGRTASTAVLSFTTAASTSPPPAPGTGSYTLVASPTTAVAGGTVTISWTAPAGNTAADWIALYQVGSQNREYRWYAYTRGATSGTVTATIRSGDIGLFEFRYLVNNSYTDITRSNIITVVGK